jgi:type III secretion apparatus YscR/HrcR family protein
MNYNPIILIGTLAVATLLPFLVASGSCFVKFSIVFSLIRNAIGLQQVPSNLTLQGLALIMTAFVMTPIFEGVGTYYNAHPPRVEDPASVEAFLNHGLADYRRYLARYADPELVQFFTRLRDAQARRDNEPPSEEAPTNPEDALIDAEQAPLFALLPAYTLTELKDAFRIGFYIYLPFLVVDMLVSNILLTLGMMMMSPITISLPIKLILFVAMDGWDKVVKGLILQYVNIAS